MNIEYDTRFKELYGRVTTLKGVREQLVEGATDGDVRRWFFKAGTDLGRIVKVNDPALHLELREELLAGLSAIEKVRPTLFRETFTGLQAVLRSRTPASLIGTAVFASLGYLANGSGAEAKVQCETGQQPAAAGTTSKALDTKKLLANFYAAETNPAGGATQSTGPVVNV